MPRKRIEPDMTQETHEDVADVMEHSTMDEKMDQILIYLHRMDRRDRLRTVGGFFRGMLAIIPLAFFLWSAWYFYAHGDELMEQLTEQAAKSAAEYSQQEAGDLMDQLEQYMR